MILKKVFPYILIFSFNQMASNNVCAFTNLFTNSRLNWHPKYTIGGDRYKKESTRNKRFYSAKGDNIITGNSTKSTKRKRKVNVIDNPPVVSGAPTPTASKNYIITYIPRTNGNLTTNDVYLNSGDKSKVKITIEYIDGLGRPLQTVDYKGSPLGRDIIHPYAYDSLGRDFIKYQPYTYNANTIDGAYKSSAIDDVTSFYSNPSNPSTWNAPNIKSTIYPNSETNFEPSPLDRAVEQGYPGEYWQLSNKTANSGHNTKIDYRTNDATSLTTGSGRWAKRYDVSLDANGKASLIDNGSYNLNQLDVGILKDENWTTADGKIGTLETYRNFNNQIVLKRNYNNAGEILSTYYIYDIYGNLTYILPPNALPDAGGMTTAKLNAYCYQYRFDSRNRIIEKQLPGTGKIYSVYNKLNMVVATQDSLEVSNKQWTFFKYDPLGRSIASGLWNNGNVSISRIALQAKVDSLTSYWETRDNTNAGNQYYSLTAFPKSSIVNYLTINYYDDYNIPSLPGLYNQSALYSTKLKGQVTASMTNVLGTANLLWSVQYYDDNGRGIKTILQHFLGATVNNANYDETSVQYSFLNETQKTTRIHHALNNSNLTITDSMTYDLKSRLINTWERINSGTNFNLSRRDYNELGTLVAKNIYSKNSGSTFLQRIVYQYNERGWLNKDSAALFVSQLVYNNGIVAPFNGNISKQLWGTGSNLNYNYSYLYDKINRLTSGVSNEGYNESNITYDKSGNILTLTRSKPSASPITYAYNYTGNQLTTIPVISSTNYQYDGNGNVKYDPRNNVTISYNLLNRPQSVSGSKTISYAYDASGNKLRSNNTALGITDYINGIQYKNGTLDYFSNDVGIARRNADGSFTYEFSLQDHLGSLRVAFRDSSGVATPVQKDDYYPFGLDIPRYTSGVKTTNLFNGSELLQDLTLYDFGARIYDPVIARWNMVDPRAEKFSGVSPYNFAVNNPVKRMDPDGRNIIFVIKRNVYGQITNVAVTAVVYISGSGASDAKAKELNSFAKTVLKTKTDKNTGVNVSFDVQFKYDENKKESSLGAGENLLTFSAKPEAKEATMDDNFANRSKVSGGTNFDVNDNATIMGSGKDNRTVLHETLHLMGLSDRYDESLYSTSDDPKPKIYSKEWDGFENDIMGGANKTDTKFNDAYLIYFANAAQSASESYILYPMTIKVDYLTGSQTSAIPYSEYVDRIRSGTSGFATLTPYENTPIHVSKPGFYSPGFLETTN